MEFNDGSSWRIVTDPVRQLHEREMFEFRVASATDKNPRGVMEMYVDTAFERHRSTLRGMRALLMYQFPYSDFSPEVQANFFCDAIGSLRDHEMIMLDIEAGSGIANPADFSARWLAVAEERLQTLSWVYVPLALTTQSVGPLTRKVTQNRIVKSPRYSGNATVGLKPSWFYDVHQYTDRGYFPGCADPAGGDVNITDWTVDRMLARCSGAPSDIVTARRARAMPLRGTGA